MPKRPHLGLAATLKWRGFELAAETARLLPVASRLVAPLAGEVACRIAHRQRSNVLHNLRVLEPDAAPERLGALSRSVFRSVARYYVELLQLPNVDLPGYFARVQVDHYENLTGALARGSGAIVAGIHIGPAEVVLHGLAAHGISYTAVVERLEPPQLADLLRGIREAHGQRYIYPDLSGTRQLIRTLRAGGVVALLIDRDVLGTGVEVSFCGAPIRVPGGPIELARLTGATIVPAVARWREDGGVAVAILPPFELTGRKRNPEIVRADMERLLARFEPHLRRRPGQWLVLERLWRGHVSKQRAAYTELHTGGR